MSAVYFLRDGNKYPVAVVRETWCPDEIEIENPTGCIHSEEFVQLFMGYLFAKGCLAEGIEPQRLLDTWTEFKALGLQKAETEVKP